ncbi:MAG: HEAT repeat domain-containing protein [Pirellula sp.]|nr:HEAT repeat domain-containing protein [Pirellula sp.]
MLVRIVYLMCVISLLGPLHAQDEGSPPTKRRIIITPLQKAIEAGLNEGLSDRIDALELDELALRSDAEAICDALRSLPLESLDLNAYDSAAVELIELFELVDDVDSGAYAVLSTDGLTILRSMFDALAPQAAADGNAYLLHKILLTEAQFASLQGTNHIIDAIKMPFQPESYLWWSTLAQFTADHPFRARLLQPFHRKLPVDGIAATLLSTSNDICLQDENASHPFDTDDGKQRLLAWLQDPDPERFDRAHGAAIAIAFLSEPELETLITAALEHPNKDVQIEGAWAAGRAGKERGLQALANYCLEIGHSSRAQSYLEEIGRPDMIPEAAREPAFRARAEFSGWLSHPNELGVIPDQVEIVDQRALRWPLQKEPSDFFVLRYRLKDRTGLDQDDEDCGLVGSQTWCFFTMKMHQRPPEDVYAIHAYWEMRNEDLIKESDATDETKLNELLASWKGEPISDLEWLATAKVSRRLKISSRTVALAKARLGDQLGNIVFDGDDTTWYPSNEQPLDPDSHAVLMLHVGRKILGFPVPGERKGMVHTPAPVDIPQWLSTFERYLDELPTASSDRKVELFEGLLAQHMEQYLEYCEASRGISKNDNLLLLVPKLISATEGEEESIRKELLDAFSAVGKITLPYVDALVANQRSSEVSEFFERMAPYNDHLLGYRTFARGAVRAGLNDLAERYLIRIMSDHDTYYETEEMADLARIWFHRGDVSKAKELLLDCISKSDAASEKSEFPDERKRLTKHIELMRKTYAELFPDDKAASEAKP